MFEGGFLGLDNIGVFDRSKPLPGGGDIEQSDGTSWMAMYCLNMLAIALELASKITRTKTWPASSSSTFMYIAEAMNDIGGDGGLWDEKDGFYLRCAAPAGREIVPDEGALDGGVDSRYSRCETMEPRD